MNGALGSTFQPIIKHCLDNKIISRTYANQRFYWAICPPEWDIWDKKVRALREIWYRQEMKKNEKIKKARIFENLKFDDLIKSFGG